MLKQIKWNKKRKWINTRYAKPYKARRAIKHMQMAQACAIGAQLVSTIAAAPASDALQRASKSMAAAIGVINTQQVILSVADTLGKIKATKRGYND